MAYVRLHGDEELYVSGYDDEALDMWAARVTGWAEAGHDVVVYFDNDAKVRAPVDAMALMTRLGLRPLEPTPRVTARPANSRRKIVGICTELVVVSIKLVGACT